MSNIKASLYAHDNDLEKKGDKCGRKTKDWRVEGLAPGAETFPS